VSDNNKTPVSLIIVPPIVSGFMLGLTGAMIAHGVGSDPWVWGGTGVFIGFVYGTLIWSSLLTKKDDGPKRWDTSMPALAPPTRVQLELRREEGNYLSVDWLDLPDNLDMGKLKEVAKIVVANSFDFSHATLAGANKPLMRTSEYEPLRDRLLVLGLLKWKNPSAHNQGLVVTDMGKVFFRTLSTHQPDAVSSFMKWMRESMLTHAHTENS
jgi:hypothetical protein